MVGYVDDPIVSDASGLAASRVHPDVLYTHNDGAQSDGGRSPTIFAISATNASLLGSFSVTGAENVDWEDIAVGPCPDKGSCIYIEDAGHVSGRAYNSIFRVREPTDIHYTGNDVALPLDSTLKFTYV